MQTGLDLWKPGRVTSGDVRRREKTKGGKRRRREMLKQKQDSEGKWCPSSRPAK